MTKKLERLTFQPKTMKNKKNKEKQMVLRAS
jgi:hypothetical protein